MDEDLRILEEEFCPPLDPALVSAILSDYEGQPDALGQARTVLDTFTHAAAAEQLTDFDASGNSSGLANQSPGKHSTEDAESNADTWATQTTLTDHSHISNELAALSVGAQSRDGSEDSPERGYWRGAEQYTTPKKETVLAETFPNLRPDLIAYTLQKAHNDLEKATDELLNHAYFEDSRARPTEEGLVAKGIDAFSEDYHIPQRGRKGKNKKRQKMSVGTVGPVSAHDSPPMSPNHWLNISHDVGYITSRTSLSHKTVASLYHANGASLSTTILAIVRKEIEAHKKDGEPDAALVQDAIGLHEAFPNIDLEYALALVRLAEPSVTKAHDLAKALMEQPASETGGKGGIKLDLRYAPVHLGEEEDQVSKLPVLAPSLRIHDSGSLARVRGDAFQQASSAYRKGKSTPLMRQAAAYYAQEGRDYNANLKAMSQVEADSHVALQSGTTYLDLHGVTVANATRIAKQRTQAWWDSLGERRIREWGSARGGVGEGYRIVTGLGRHSEGGRGKIGPAVLKTLMNDGWRVEVGTGELRVTGLSRRK
ncbi:hypothetical protein BDU57DRAFT_523535 [Ampelomyces quisqualis]|uniref:Smr domain-containing protein n=1 Tax=Ampelomyces quisqualis TaxID=50730 RepID=A0A6A5QBI3_AMPQU|nr:hypothetical protein BDU57DRAFT_523535 [Ampelomyces quisqualis]